MKLAICGDVHWSEYSSILRSRGTNYSTRLENLIASINWFIELAISHGCQAIIFLGDFFDRSDCNAEELSALKELRWPESNIPIYFLCGNHEMGRNNHEYSSAKLFELLPKGIVVSEPSKIDAPNFELCFLPYVLESNRESIESYFGPMPTNKRRVIISHNDISGIQMGAFLSQIGFTVDEIESNCDLFLNGHLHNGCQITHKIINVGNITGQNFSEDGFKYMHAAYILDADTFKFNTYENPFALNFYKLDATENKVNLNILSKQSVITLKCYHDDVPTYKELISNSNNIVESRIIVEVKQSDSTLTESVSVDDLSVDHLSEFRKFILSNIGTGEIIESELEEICK